MEFYTNVDMVGNRILHRYVDENGERQAEWANFMPTLFTQTIKHTQYHDISGNNVVPMTFDGLKEAKDEIKLMSDIANAKIYGDIKWTSMFVNDRYFDNINFDKRKLVIANIDIETQMINFKAKDWGDKQLFTITVGVNGKYFAFGYKNFTGKLPKNAEYIHCDDEEDLFMRFLKFWGDLEPNIVTGWNTNGFDIPFLIMRIRRLFGDETANRLAPTARKFTKKCISEREFDGKVEYELVGIEMFDLMLMYKKFTFKMRESYSLNYIAHVELGEEKIHYAGNLEDLYHNDYNKFILYNIKDVELVDRIDNARNLMLLVLTLGYMSHIKLGDTFYQLRMWDSIIYNRLLQDKVVVPGNERSSKSEKYQGAYVNEPKTGFHDWVVSFDLNSLYPHIIEGMNISPEKQIKLGSLLALTDTGKKESVEYLVSNMRGDKISLDIVDMVNGEIPENLTKSLVDLGIGMSANGCLWDNTTGQGFLGGIMHEQYQQRKSIKKEMLTHGRNVELIKEILKERNND